MTLRKHLLEECTSALWPFQIDGEGIVYRTGHAVESFKDRSGYLLVHWYFDGVKRLSRLHTLVWATHVGPLPPDQEIDHIDGDKENNQISNLRLVSHHENILSARKLKGNWSPSKLLPHQVELLLALAPNLPKGKGPLMALALRWHVSKFALGNLRAKAKREGDARYGAGL